MNKKQELINLITELNEAHLIEQLPFIFSECDNPTDSIEMSCNHCPLHNQEHNDWCDRFHDFV